MVAKSISSNEFASLVKKLQGSPNNPELKQAILKHLPEMRALAGSNSLALYHLAYIFPPNSGQHKQALLQAADKGCTNAMLDACKLLVKSGKPADMKKAAHYLLMIEQSNDSYIIQHSKSLLADSPQLARAVQEQRTQQSSQNIHRFFPVNRERTVEAVGIEQRKTHNIN